MSNPERTARFCSSIFALSRSLNFRFTAFKAAFWSRALAWILTIWLPSSSKTLLSRVSYNLVARICKKETAPKEAPVRK